MDISMWEPAEADRESDGFLVGLAVGTVTDNRDPDGLARVRVRLPWHLDGETSFWARSAMPMAGPGRGVYFVPEIGDEVLVGAEGGDPSHLYVLGMLWNGAQKPPVRDDGGNHQRLIRTRSGHRLRFNDDPASPEVEVSLNDGMKRVLLDRDTIVVEDGNRNVLTFTASTGSIEISAARELSLRAPTVTVEATTSMTVSSSGTLTVRGGLVQIN